MGRTTNPLVKEYFERGEKQKNATGRYVHSCKKCGEEIPSGRVEKMMAHITRSCSALSLPQRTRIVLKLYDFTDLPSVGDDLSDDKDNTAIPSLPNLPSQSSDQQSFDRLNVLAEASRQVDGTQRPADGSIDIENVNIPDIPLDPNQRIFTNMFREDTDSLFENSSGLASANTSYPTHPLPQANASFHGVAMPSGLIPNTNSLLSGQSNLESMAASATARLDSQSLFLPDKRTSQQQGPPRIMMPTPAMNHISNMNGGSAFMFATALPAPNIQTTGGDQNFLNMNNPFLVQNQMSNAMVGFTAPQQTHFITQNGVDPVAAVKPKVRSKFTPERRREITHLRKKGACVRCRILRKPCSGDDPCTTCSRVATARIWTAGCVRYRLPEEMDAFLVNLHSVKAHDQVTSIKDRTVDHKTIKAEIEVLGLDGVIMSVELTRSQLSPDARIRSVMDPVLTLSVMPDALETVYSISANQGQIITHLDDLIEQLPEQMVDIENSRPVKLAVECAFALVEKRDDSILQTSITLWVWVTLFVRKLEWGVTIQPSDGIGENTQTTTLDSNIHPRSQNLITTQLTAALEKKIHGLFRAATVELDQRLFERHPTGKFDIYMATFILFNSLERMCWYYRALQIEQINQWTATQTPSSLINIIDRFCEMTASIMRTRYICPRLVVDPATEFLVVLSENQERDADSMALFKRLGFLYNNSGQFSTPIFDIHDSKSLDGQFLAKILHPTSETDSPWQRAHQAVSYG